MTLFYSNLPDLSMAHGEMSHFFGKIIILHKRAAYGQNADIQQTPANSARIATALANTNW
jgi:hypothetical protein